MMKIENVSCVGIGSKSFTIVIYLFSILLCCHFYGIILIDVNVIIHIFVMDIINACFNVTWYNALLAR